MDSYFQVHHGRIHTIPEHKVAVRALDDATFVDDAGIKHRNDANHFVEGRISVSPGTHFKEPLLQGFDSGNTTEPLGRTVFLATAYISAPLIELNRMTCILHYLRRLLLPMEILRLRKSYLSSFKKLVSSVFMYPWLEPLESQVFASRWNNFGLLISYPKQILSSNSHSGIIVLLRLQF